MKKPRIRIAVSILAALTGLASPAFAGRGSTAALKQVQVSNGTDVELIFDGKVGKNQIRTEFFNDVIQLSLSDVTVYPAKISSINNGNLVKVFAYQYAPRLVRCRITVKGKADAFKQKLHITPSGKSIALRFGDSGVVQAGAKMDAITLAAAAASRVRPGAAGDQSPAAQAAAGSESGAEKAKAITLPESKQTAAMDPEERALLERVMSGAKPGEAKKIEPQKVDSQKLLGGARPLPSFTGVLLKLSAVLALFGAIVFAFRKMGGARRGLMGAITRYARNSFGQKGKMIDVLSTHHLGPKKSIAVVRVLGRVLVLGVTSDSVNLITQLSGEGQDFDLEALAIAPIDRATAPSGATAAGPGVFADLLMVEKTKPAPVSASSAGMGGGVRAQIRSRLEGLKPL